MSSIKGAFPQSTSTYINIRQPLRLNLFEQNKAKVAQAKADAKNPSKQREALHKSIKFSSDNAFGYKNKKITNPNVHYDHEPTNNTNHPPPLN